MKGTIISFKGNTYNRVVEMLGDVEKITWFQCFEGNVEKEIYDGDILSTLEGVYEDSCLQMITPQQFYI
jgi:hypothetical protein